MKHLLEEENIELEYGALMVDFDLPKWQWFTDKLIDEADLQPQEWMDNCKAKYDSPHVTILYGFLPSVDLQDIKPLLPPVQTIQVTFDTINIFENPEFDVVKFEGESKQLRAINKVVQSVPHADLYDTYNIHMTIAYVKPHVGEKYIRNITPFALRPYQYSFFHPNRRESESFIL